MHVESTLLKFFIPSFIKKTSDVIAVASTICCAVALMWFEYAFVLFTTKFSTYEFDPHKSHGAY